MKKKYVVAWNYKSSLGQLAKGAEVEMEEVTARVFNVDSPGVLVEIVKKEPKQVQDVQVEKRVEEGKQDRMVRKSSKRSK